MLKKAAVILMILVITMAMMVTPAFAEDGYSYVKTVQLIIGDKNAYVNDTEVLMDQAAYVKSGRTLVPFRFLAEALGATVLWDGKTSTASLSLGGSEVKVTIGSKNASINGKETLLDVPAELKGGRTFIPLRFVSEALGAKVDYDPDIQAIDILLIDTSGWKAFDDSTGVSILYPYDWTLTGDSTVGLNIVSPKGTKLTFNYVQGQIDKIIEDKKAAYTKDGFDIVEEGLIDPDDVTKGYTIVFNKEDTTDFFESQIVAVNLIEIDTEIQVTEMSTTLNNNIYDGPIIEKMISE